MRLRYGSLLLAAALLAVNAWPQSSGTFEVLLPRIADGDLGGIIHRTTFILVNPGADPVDLTLDLTQESGDPFQVRLLEQGATAGFASLFNFRVSAGGSRVFETASTGAGQVGSARITANARVIASGILSILDRNGVVIMEAGIGSSPPLTDFRLPADVRETFNTGVAFYNPGLETAEATVELFDGNGTSRGTTNLTLQPNTSVARFVDQFFQIAGQLQGSLRITSSKPLAAIALRLKSSPLTFTTLPVVAESSQRTEFNLPQTANGSQPGVKCRTSFLIFSLSPSEAQVNIRLTNDDGNPLVTPIQDLGADSSFDLTVPGNGTRFLETTGEGSIITGSARITSSVPVGVLAIFTIFDGQDNFLTEAGIGDSLPFTAAALPVGVADSFDTGLALFNPNSFPVDVNMILIDTGGRRVGSAGTPPAPLPSFRITLPAGAHQARFVTQFFSGLGNFTGTLGIAASAEIAAITLRQNHVPLSFTTLPVEEGSLAPAGGDGIILNEVVFVGDADHPQFVELKVAPEMTQLVPGLQLVTSEGETYSLTADAHFDPQTGLLLILFDSQNRVEGATVHADRIGFLNPDTGFVALLNREGLLLDRIGWGAGQAGTARLGRGGVLYELDPGSSIARLPDSTQDLAFGDWSSFPPDQATPGGVNILPAVGVLIPLSGAISDSPDISLSWYPVAGMQSYRVQVSSEETFQTLAADIETPVSLVDVTGVQSGEYFWRVQGITAGGQVSAWSPIESFEVQAPAPAALAVVPLQETINNSIAVPLIAQKKDTRMLLMEAAEDQGSGHRWDQAHPATDPDDPADYMNCILATVVMVNRFYGGQLSQDRLGYEFLKDRSPFGPEWDLVYGDPKFSPNHHLEMLTWALRPSVRITTSTLDLSPEGLNTFWGVIRTSIDNRQPIIIWLAESGRNKMGHAVVIHGYREVNDRRSVYVRDSWLTGTTPRLPSRSLEKTAWAGGYWVIPPQNQTDPRSDEPEIALDSDRDGVVDFDETDRFDTLPDRFDTDGDLIGDGREIRGSVFDPQNGYRLKVTGKTWLQTIRDYFLGSEPAEAGSTERDDLDRDGDHMEKDFDSDGGGCSDGFEDTNWNGERDDGERSNFARSDDKCHIQGIERRTLSVLRSSFRLNELLTENVEVNFCAGPPILLNGSPNSAPNRARVEWKRKTAFSYQAQNFYCAEAFTATYDFGTVSYVAGVNGGTSAVTDGVTVLASPLTRGVEKTANRAAPGACAKFNEETPETETWAAQFGMWFGVGAGTVAPWNYAFFVPWSGFGETYFFPTGQGTTQSSDLDIWFVDRTESEASKPCQLRGEPKPAP